MYLLEVCAAIDFDFWCFFGGFPIKGQTAGLEWEFEVFPVPPPLRGFLSFFWYVFFLVTPIFCICKDFKGKVFYEKYKAVWWFAAPLFTLLTGVLTGYLPFYAGHEGIKYFIIFYVATVFITLLPAYLQYKYYHRS